MGECEIRFWTGLGDVCHFEVTEEGIKKAKRWFEDAIMEHREAIDSGYRDGIVLSGLPYFDVKKYDYEKDFEEFDLDDHELAGRVRRLTVPLRDWVESFDVSDIENHIEKVGE